MKKVLPWLNLIFLILNAVLFCFFTVYTVLGVKPFGAYVTEDFIQTQLLIALAFELVCFAVSYLISKVLKKDLSFKGPDVFKFVPKPMVLAAVILGVAAVFYTVITKISSQFVVTVIFMGFSILIEIGITKYFFKSENRNEI